MTTTQFHCHVHEAQNDVNMQTNLRASDQVNGMGLSRKYWKNIVSKDL